MNQLENVHMITDLPTKRILGLLQWQTFLRVLPTRWRQKSTGIYMEQNYVTDLRCKNIQMKIKNVKKRDKNLKKNVCKRNKKRYLFLV